MLQMLILELLFISVGLLTLVFLKITDVHIRPDLLS